MCDVRGYLSCWMNENRQTGETKILLYISYILFHLNTKSSCVNINVKGYKIKSDLCPQLIHLVFYMYVH